MARPKQKESFSLFPEVFAVTSVLNNEQFGELVRAAFAYWQDGTEYVSQEPAMTIAFGFVASGLDRRKQVSEANAECANARWHSCTPQAAQLPCESVFQNYEMRNDAKSCETIISHNSEMRNDAPVLSSPVLSSPVQSNPNQSCPDQSNSSQEVYGAASAPAHTRKKFQKPTVEQVEAYCAEQGLEVDAQRFVDYYESVGWVIGKGKPMKNWQAAARTWARSQSPPEEKYIPPEPVEIDFDMLSYGEELLAHG